MSAQLLTQHEVPLRRAFFWTLAIACGVGLLGGLAGVNPQRQSRQAELAGALFECKLAIRPLLRGGLEFVSRKSKRTADGYLIHIDVSHDVVVDGTPRHAFVCLVSIEDGRARVRSVREDR